MHDLNKSNSILFDKTNLDEMVEKHNVANRNYDNEIKRLTQELSNANSTIEKLKVNENKLKEKYANIFK